LLGGEGSGGGGGGWSADASHLARSPHTTRVPVPVAPLQPGALWIHLLAAGSSGQVLASVPLLALAASEAAAHLELLSLAAHQLHSTQPAAVACGLSPGSASSPPCDLAGDAGGWSVMPAAPATFATLSPAAARQPFAHCALPQQAAADAAGPHLSGGAHSGTRPASCAGRSAGRSSTAGFSGAAEASVGGFFTPRRLPPIREASRLSDRHNPDDTHTVSSGGLASVGSRAGSGAFRGVAHGSSPGVRSLVSGASPAAGRAGAAPLSASRSLSLGGVSDLSTGGLASRGQLLAHPPGAGDCGPADLDAASDLLGSPVTPRDQTSHPLNFQAPPSYPRHPAAAKPHQPAAAPAAEQQCVGNGYPLHQLAADAAAALYSSAFDLPPAAAEPPQQVAASIPAQNPRAWVHLAAGAAQEFLGCRAQLWEAAAAQLRRLARGATQAITADSLSAAVNFAVAAASSPATAAAHQPLALQDLRQRSPAPNSPASAALAGPLAVAPAGLSPALLQEQMPALGGTAAPEAAAEAAAQAGRPSARASAAGGSNVAGVASGSNTGAASSSRHHHHPHHHGVPRQRVQWHVLNLGEGAAGGAAASASASASGFAAFSANSNALFSGNMFSGASAFGGGSIFPSGALFGTQPGGLGAGLTSASGLALGGGLASSGGFALHTGGNHLRGGGGGGGRSSVANVLELLSGPQAAAGAAAPANHVVGGIDDESSGSNAAGSGSGGADGAAAGVSCGGFLSGGYALSAGAHQQRTRRAAATLASVSGSGFAVAPAVSVAPGPRVPASRQCQQPEQAAPPPLASSASRLPPEPRAPLRRPPSVMLLPVEVPDTDTDSDGDDDDNDSTIHCRSDTAAGALVALGLHSYVPYSAGGRLVAGAATGEVTPPRRRSASSYESSTEGFCHQVLITTAGVSYQNNVVVQHGESAAVQLSPAAADVAAGWQRLAYPPAPGSSGSSATSIGSPMARGSSLPVQKGVALASPAAGRSASAPRG